MRSSGEILDSEFQPAARPEPLRVGLLIDSFRQPQWVRTIVEGIQRSDFARVALIVENGDVDRPERGFVRKVLKNRQRLAYVLYTRLDERLFRKAPDAFTEVSIADLLADVPTRRVTPIKKRFSDYFTDEDVAAIREFDLDVVLRLGFRILRGEALKGEREATTRGVGPGWARPMVGARGFEPRTSAV